MSGDGQPAYEGWAIVEVMGHRRLADYVREVMQYGIAMLRVDVPASSHHPEPVTQFYPGSALFSVTPCSPEAARKEAAALPSGQPYRLTYGSDW